MKTHEGCGIKIQIFTAMTLGRGRVASPMLGRLCQQGKHQYSFYRRLSGPQHQCGDEGVKKNLHNSDTRDRTRTLPLELPGPP